jgi:HK97 family phage portal protein
MLQKAIGFPAWNISSSAPQGYRDFFSAINGDEAMRRLSTVYTCCNLLGRRVATLPIDIVESDGEISRPVPNYIGGLLTQPNEFMNKIVYLEAVLLSINLRGNSYSEIVRIGNRITSLWPLPFERVRVRWDRQNLIYDVSLPDGSIKPMQPRDILHIRNFSTDGIIGLTPLQLHAVKRGVAAADFQENFFRNGARPSIAFSSPDKPDESTQKRARETAERLYSGPENAGRILFLWGGVTTSNLSLSPVDAEVIKTLEMSDAEIGAAYGVPMNLLNKTDKTATYASAEQFNRYFVDYTIDPLCQRVAMACTEKLLNPRLNANGRSISVKFNLDALLAGDSLARANYLKTLVSAGLMKPNEARAKLNLPPMAGGDELVIQSNMTTLDGLENLANQPKPLPQLMPPPPSGTAPKAKTISGVDWDAITEQINAIRWKASIQ